ncbi:protein kinase domain-containing protein [Nocardia brasiliensis]
MTTERPPRTVGTRFGPYRLDRLIGRGGIGEVFEAYDTVKDRTVAVKVLAEKLNQDPVFRERFRRESHAAARLTEPHVIPIHDYGEIDGQLYIDMRLVDGENLRAVLKREAPLAPERAVAVIRQIAAALDAAHADDLVHRDIKPDNILLTTDGFAYLVDFGIAQSSTSESLTADGSAIGSFHYMAPERFTSRLVTPAVDSYALACVLYECLTGARPFPAETDGEIMRAHLFEPPPRPSMIRREVPAAFDEVIARGLAKNPNARYTSAGDLAAAAHRALTGTATVTGAQTEPAAEPPPTQRVQATTAAVSENEMSDSAVEAALGKPAKAQVVPDHTAAKSGGHRPSGRGPGGDGTDAHGADGSRAAGCRADRGRSGCRGGAGYGHGHGPSNYGAARRRMGRDGSGCATGNYGFTDRAGDCRPDGWRASSCRAGGLGAGGRSAGGGRCCGRGQGRGCRRPGVCFRRPASALR